MTNDTPGDWTYLSNPEVTKIISRTARVVAFDYSLDANDLEQDARILVATKLDLLVCLLDDNHLTLGALQYRLRQDLIDLARVAADKRARNTSYDARFDNWKGAIDSPPYSSVMVDLRVDVTGYTLELVEELMPAIWDEWFCASSRRENAPDADMPRGSTNKATGNTLAAHIADIKTGWKKAMFDLKSRQVLFLRFSLDWTESDIAFNLGMGQSTVSDRIRGGVGLVARIINGHEGRKRPSQRELIRAA